MLFSDSPLDRVEVLWYESWRGDDRSDEEPTQVTELDDFVGTWRADEGAPYSTHTFTWERAGAYLRGRWVIKAANSEAAHVVVAAARPAQFEMQVGKPWLEDGLLLFHVNGGPYLTEFRLVGPAEAVVGAAVKHLPPEFTRPEDRHSIEAHRVRLTKQTGDAA